MTFDEIIAYSLTKPDAFVCHPFGDEDGGDTVKVRFSDGSTRIIAMTFVLRGKPCATFRCDAGTGLLLRGLHPEAVTRGWHCPPSQQPYFNTVDLAGDVPDGAIYEMIDNSYEYVLSKMPKRVREEAEAERRLLGDNSTK